MNACCDRLRLIHFADDTTAVCVRDDLKVLVEEVNLDLLKVKEWVDTNRLSLNVEKTNYILITDSDPNGLQPVMISGQIINRVTCCRFLGLYFDDKLTFKFHTNELCKKLSRVVGMMNRISGMVPPSVKIKIYNSLIYSRVSYGVAVWGGASSANISRMDRLLKRAYKYVSFGCRGFSIASNSFFKFSSIYDYFSMLKFYRIVSLGEHRFFATILGELMPSHDHNTRFVTNNLLNTPRLSKTKCQRMFLYRSVAMWNSLPESIKSCPSILGFKKMLKQHILGKLVS